MTSMAEPLRCDGLTQADHAQLYELLVSELTDFAVFLIDPTGCIASWNPGVERLLGYQEHEWVGQPAHIIFTPEDRAAKRPEEEMTVARRNGRAPDNRWHQRKDGSRLFVEGTMVALKDTSGVLLGFSKVMRDVTARQQAEAALLASEVKYRQLFDSIDEGFCIIEVLFDGQGKAYDYRFLEANPAFEKHTGFSDAMGRTIRELVPDIEPHWSDLYGKVALTGAPVRYENRAKEMGRFYDVFAFRIGEPEQCRVAVLFSDITDRERMKQEVVASRERLNQVFQQSPVAIVVFRGPEFVVELANPPYLALLQKREVVGRRFADVVPELSKDVWDAFRHVMDTGEPFVRSDFHILYDQDGNGVAEDHWFNVAYHPLREGNGAVSGLVAVSSEVHP